MIHKTEPSLMSRILRRLYRSSVASDRMSRLKAHADARLDLGHIDSLELFDLLPKEDIKTIFDVGANRGTWTTLAKIYFPNSVVHAFEPLKLCEQEFKQRTDSYSDVYLHNLALGAREGNFNIYITDNIDSSSSLMPLDAHEREFGVKLHHIETAEFVAIDSFVAKKSISWPELIKLDVQGAEIDVLRGGTELLNRTKYIIVELSFVELYEKGCLAHEITSYLGNSGFQLVAFSRGIEGGSRLVQADALFVKDPQQTVG